MTKIRVTKRAFPRRITYTHLARPLMRHSSRIKLFTRNWPKSPVTLFSSSLLYDSSNFVPPPPSSTLRGKEKSSAEKKGSVAAIFMANPWNGSSLSILKKKLLQKRSPDRARLIYFECTAREKFEEFEEISSKWFFENGCETRRMEREEGSRGGRKWYWSARRKHSLSTTDFFPRDATRGRRVNSARFLHPWRSWRIEGGKRGHSGLLARQGMLLLRYRRDTGGGNESTVVHTRCFFGYRFVFIARIFFCFGFRSLERNDSFFSVAISFKDFSKERVANSRTKSFFLLFRWILIPSFRRALDLDIFITVIYNWILRRNARKLADV